MITVHDSNTPLCDGLTRREWLHLGGLGIFGLSMVPQWSVALTDKPKTFKKCIVLFFLGGPPQHETWDPKPNAPSEVRGEARPIATSVPGIQVGEWMPKTARLAHHLCIVRAMRTRDNAHTASGYYMCTGVPHQPMNVENALPGAPNDHPCLAAVIRHLRRGSALPSSIMLPEVLHNDSTPKWPGQDAGWLGRSADPWLLTCDPSSPRFNVKELQLPAEVTPGRFRQRYELLQQLNSQLDKLQQSPAIERYDIHSRQVLDLLRSPQCRRAFAIDREPPALRDRYTRTKFGQSVLLARRLLEAGVSLVQVNWTRLPGAPNNGHWDTHSKNAEALKNHLMPLMDQVYSTLLEDLADRGLLDETLVVWMGEFGRSPKINGRGGRDHWGRVFSVALAGAGVRAGSVYGASDKLGAEPKDGVVNPEDLTATVFHLLGHSPHTEIRDTQNRPVPISRGRIVKGLLA